MKGLRFAIVFIFLLGSVSAKRLNTNHGRNESVSSGSVPVEWQVYLDPQKDEFWTEGNHVPDKGFLLFIKNPTEENAKLWLLRNEIKAKYLSKAMKVVERVNLKLIKSKVIQDRYDWLEGTKKKVNKKIDLSKTQKLNYYFLFKPDCGHCKKMASTLKKMKNVRPLQVSGGKLHHWSGLNKSTYASQETIEDYLTEKATPVLIIQNPKNNKVYRMVGNKGIRSIVNASMEVL